MKSKTFKKRMLRTLVNILSLLAMVLGTIQILQISNKIIMTSADLMVISSNVNYYNEHMLKNSTTEEFYLANDNRRQELYNNDDVIIREFSSIENSFVKAGVLLLAISMYPMMIVVWATKFRSYCRKVRRRNLAKMKRKKELENMEASNQQC